MTMGLLSRSGKESYFVRGRRVSRDEWLNFMLDREKTENLFTIEPFLLLTTPGQTVVFNVPQVGIVSAMLFSGVRAVDVLSVELRIRGLLVAQIGSGVDESGETVTAGEMLRITNGQSGAYINGCQFALVFDDFGGGINFDGSSPAELRIQLSENHRQSSISVACAKPFNLKAG